MRITVFGATGRLGSEIVQAALDQGFSVTAHSRKPIIGSTPGVEWVTGDLGLAVNCADAVIVSFGPRSPTVAPFCASDTQKILDGMRRWGVGRILCVTGAMIGDYPKNRTWCFQHLSIWMHRRYSTSMDDRVRQEILIRCSGTNWTVFKPPRLTTNKSHRNVTIGPTVRVGVLSNVARADRARSIVEEIQQESFNRQCVFVKSMRGAARVTLPASKEKH